MGVVAAIIGHISWRMLFGFMGLFVLFAARSPLLVEVVAGLDAWVQVILLGILGLVLRGLLALLNGPGLRTTSWEC